MKKSQVLLWALSIVTGVLIVGCTKNDGTGPSGTGPSDLAPAGVTNEVQAMNYFAASDAFVTNDEVTFADQTIATANYGTFGKVDAAVTPLRWGRFVTSVTKTINTTVQPGDTSALVTIDKVVSGTLKISARTGAGDTTIIEKPFSDHSVRNIILERTGRNPKKFWMNWIPVASTLVSGGTQPPEPNNQIQITQLQVFLAGGDTITVTDPTTYYLRYSWLKLFHGGRKDVPDLIGGQALKLRATVVSTSHDTDIVALRYGMDLLHTRRALLSFVSETDNNNGSFTRVFEIAAGTPQFVHFHRGSFNLGIDALTRGTLYDDTAPYSVSWWGLPYRVM